MEAEEVMSDMIAESTNILALADQDRFADAQKFQDKAVDPVVDDEKIDAEMASDKMVEALISPATKVRKRSAKAKVLSAARHLLIKQEIVNSTRVKQEPSSASLPAPLSGPHDPTPSRIPDFILAEREFWDAVLYAELFTTENPFLFCKHVTFVAICQQLLSQLWPSETYVIRYSDELFDKRPADDPSTFVVVQPITRLLLLLFLLSDTLFNIDHDEMGEGRKLEESANR
ncbi:hypothetical protein EV121DRAFT_297328 [Schizophyllum commune]